MNKKALSILLVVSMIFSLIPSSLMASSVTPTYDNKQQEQVAQIQNPFKDVSQEDWYYDAVMYGIQNNIFSGTDQGNFSPFGTMTRGMYVTVLGRMAGVDVSQYTKVNFQDVTQGAYYAPYVTWAVEKGITAGVDQEHFAPNEPITREQLAVFTVHYFEALGVKYSEEAVTADLPKDLESIASWAREAVLKLWKIGIIKGDEKGNFNPKVAANRAEAVSFSMRTHQILKGMPVSPVKPPTGGSSGSSSSESTSYYTVTFNSNGGSQCDSMQVASGKGIKDLPIPQKIGSIFFGWYTEPTLGEANAFTDQSIVASNMTLYAKYIAIENGEKDVNPNFALNEQEASLNFKLVSANTAYTAENIKLGVDLQSTDGSENPTLEVTGSNGQFVLSAVGGFKPGASYRLNLLSDTVSFEGKAGTVRSCSFNIKKAEIYNITLNEDMIYIPRAEVQDISKNGSEVESFTVSAVMLSEDGQGEPEEAKGSFTYKGNETIQAGDILCVYSGQKPVSGQKSSLEDEIAYLKVTKALENKIDYTEADSDEVIFLPDVLPLCVADPSQLVAYQVPTAGKEGWFIENSSELNFTSADCVAMGLDENTTVDVGDYFAFYTSTTLEAAQEAQVTYGKVTTVTVNSQNQIIVKFDTTTKDKMQEALDYYAQNDISGKKLLEGVDTKALEADIKQQVIDSGFAEGAAQYLTTLAMQTDGFNQLAGDNFDHAEIKALLGNGESVGMAQARMMAARSNKVEITKPDIRVSIGSNTQNFGSGIRCKVDVSFQVKMGVGTDNEIVINISAGFVEELKVSANASGGAIWKYKWKIFPYISDYQMNANIDLYNYTAISFQATVSSKANKDSIDVSAQIKKLLQTNKSEEVTSGVQGLFKLYKGMLNNETDFIELFSQNIFTQNIRLVLGIIHIQIKADFVVSLDINVAIGCNFDYISGTRYSFWAKIKAKDSGSNNIPLIDERYNFEFYVLGTLGIRAGVRLEIAVGLFSVDLASVGLTAEAGVYTRLYGYFYYELHMANKVKTSRSSGALYVEIGVYLEINFKAQAFKSKFIYNPTLYEHEWLLWTAGERENVYQFSAPSQGDIKLKDTTRKYTLPDRSFEMTCVDLKEGDVFNKQFERAKYQVDFSNPNFRLDGKDIYVNVPAGAHQMTCDVTITWNTSALAFSSIPIRNTIRILWDDVNNNGYTISFNSNGGSNVPMITKAYNATVTPPTPPTKTGYRFGGWYKDQQLTQPYSFSVMGYGNTMVYAKWQPSPDTAYKVEHYRQNLENNDYTLYEAERLTGMTGAGVTAAPKGYEGFTYSPSTTNTRMSGTVAPDGSLVLKVYYSRKTYQLKFNTAGGNGDLTQNMKYQAAISAPLVTKNGYNFKGWSSLVPVNMPPSDLTFNATWEAANTMLTFYTDGGTAIESIIQVCGTDIVLPPQPTKVGYTFGGWYTDKALTQGYVQSKMATQNVTLYSKWIVIDKYKYTVKHYLKNSIGEEEILRDTEKLETSDVVVVPPVKSYKGYTAPIPQPITLKKGEIAEVKYVYTYEDIATGDETSYMTNAGVRGTGSFAEAVEICTTTGGMITVQKDIELKGSVTIPGGITIEGGGHTIALGQPPLQGNQSPYGPSVLEITVNQGEGLREKPTKISNLTIVGTGLRGITNNGLLYLDGVTITRSGSESQPGGGLFNTGILNMKNCNISECVGRNGGGFVNYIGQMFMDQTSIINNRAAEQGSYGGGGGENNASLYLNNCTIANNDCSEIGGGINNYRGQLYVMNTTITGNRTTGPANYGGGIGNNNGRVEIINSILLNNYAKENGVWVSSNFVDFSGGQGMGNQIASIIGETKGIPDQITFATYEIIGGVPRPVLNVLGNKSFGASLVQNSRALNSGCPTYIYSSEENHMVKFSTQPMVDGLLCSPVNVYQDGGSQMREPNVIGALKY